MPLAPWIAVLVMLLTACNLNNQPAGLVTPPAFSLTRTPETLSPTALPLPGVTLLPNLGINVNATTLAPLGGNPTRTPFGDIPTSLLTSSSSTQASMVSATPLPILITGEGATISSPIEGATVGRVLLISGVVRNLPQNAFTLQLVGSDSAVLNTQRITLQNPHNAAEVPWSASMELSRFTGQAQIRLIGNTRDNRAAVLAAVNVMVNPNSAPANSGSAPGTSLGSITSPVDGSTITGNSIIVEGTAGNFSETTFTLVMIQGSAILNSQTVTITGGQNQLVPWAATLGTQGYRGPVEIRAFLVRDGNNITIASVNMNVG
jgi:hypothetical protein